MSNARYYFSNKRILDGEIKGAKISSLFYLISKHWWNINFLCIFFMNNLWVWVIVEKDIAWESSRHFPTPPLVSPRNWIWGTRAEIPYRWRVTRSGFSLVEANFTRGSTNQKHRRPDLGCDTSSVWNFMGSFLKRHFAGNQRWRRLMSVELTLIF